MKKDTIDKILELRKGHASGEIYTEVKNGYKVKGSSVLKPNAVDQINAILKSIDLDSEIKQLFKEIILCNENYLEIKSNFPGFQDKIKNDFESITKRMGGLGHITIIEDDMSSLGSFYERIPTIYISDGDSFYSTDSEELTPEQTGFGADSAERHDSVTGKVTPENKR